ncbi:hypothetical protein HDV05_000085 [Chytridiales sp. JEL 0842]|nr:hypothetical protein HDV05_000085 [Chytridiales sp. JEL 0842]
MAQRMQQQQRHFHTPGEDTSQEILWIDNDPSSPYHQLSYSYQGERSVTVGDKRFSSLAEYFQETPHHLRNLSQRRVYWASELKTALYAKFSDVKLGLADLLLKTGKKPLRVTYKDYERCKFFGKNEEFDISMLSNALMEVRQELKEERERALRAARGEYSDEEEVEVVQPGKKKAFGSPDRRKGRQNPELPPKKLSNRDSDSSRDRSLPGSQQLKQSTGRKPQQQPNGKSQSSQQLQQQRGGAQPSFSKYKSYEPEPQERTRSLKTDSYQSHNPISSVSSKQQYSTFASKPDPPLDKYSQQKAGLKKQLSRGEDLYQNEADVDRPPSRGRYYELDEEDYRPTRSERSREASRERRQSNPAQQYERESSRELREPSSAAFERESSRELRQASSGALEKGASRDRNRESSRDRREPSSGYESNKPERMSQAWGSGPTTLNSKFKEDSQSLKKSANPNEKRPASYPAYATINQPRKTNYSTIGPQFTMPSMYTSSYRESFGYNAITFRVDMNREDEEEDQSSYPSKEYGGAYGKSSQSKKQSYGAEELGYYSKAKKSSEYDSYNEPSMTRSLSSEYNNPLKKSVGYNNYDQSNMTRSLGGELKNSLSRDSKKSSEYGRYDEPPTMTRSLSGEPTPSSPKKSPSREFGVARKSEPQYVDNQNVPNIKVTLDTKTNRRSASVEREKLEKASGKLSGNPWEARRGYEDEEDLEDRQAQVYRRDREVVRHLEKKVRPLVMQKEVSIALKVDMARRMELKEKLITDKSDKYHQSSLTRVGPQKQLSSNKLNGYDREEDYPSSSKYKNDARDYKTAEKPRKKPTTIFFYSRGEPYFEFTNMAEGYPIMVDGVMYPTSEHFFHAMKFQPAHPNIAKQITLASSPRTAFEIARQYDHLARPDWNKDYKVAVMTAALDHKFRQHAKLKKKLLETNNAILVQHTAVDDYWADGGDGSGQNMLGELLMDLRETLKDEERRLEERKERRVSGYA